MIGTPSVKLNKIPPRYKTHGALTEPTVSIGDPETTSFSTVLNIDSTFGVLSFGMAKFIDLVWDIVISRGGQALLGWITYKVYTAALMKIMETHIVSSDLYASLTLSV
jgi:hypothetical protein